MAPEYVCMALRNKCSGGACLQFCGHMPYHKYYHGYATAVQMSQWDNFSLNIVN